MVKNKQFKLWSKDLKEKRGIGSNLKYLGHFFSSSSTGFKEKRELRRTANNGHFLKKQGNQMWEDPEYLYPLSDKYQNKFCPSCRKAEESNPHMIYKCESYEDVRQETNQRLNDYLSQEQIPLRNLLLVDLQTRGKLDKGSKTAAKDPRALAWKGYLPKDLIQQIHSKYKKKNRRIRAFNDVLTIVSQGILKIKQRRNDNFAAETYL